jgi:hypothetical protein
MGIRERWGGPIRITSEDMANRLETIAKVNPFLKKQDEAILRGLAKKLRREPAMIWTLMVDGDDDED